VIPRKGKTLETEQLLLQVQQLLVAGPIQEFRQSSGPGIGTDLNGDGDTNDLVLHVYHRDTGAIQNVGLPLFYPLLDVRIDSGRIAFRVPEFWHGDVDLNGELGVNAVGVVLHEMKEPGEQEPCGEETRVDHPPRDPGPSVRGW